MTRLAGTVICGVWLFCQTAVAHETVHVEDAKLTCGNHAFELITRWHRAEPRRLVWDSQTLIAQHSQTVDLAEPSNKNTDGFLAAVTGWKCVAGTGGDVLVLAFSCVSDDLAPCDGQREWVHLVNPVGARLDAGYKPQDDRLDGLLAHLGLDKAMNEGLSLQDVIK